MKKLVVIALAIVAVSCNGIIGNGYTISGEVKGLADGTKVFLEKQGESAASGIIGVDTVLVKGGKFEFKGEAKEPQIHRVNFDNKGGFMLILEKGNIKATVNKDSMGLAKVSGTFNNDELLKYNENLMGIQKKMMAFENKNMKAFQAAQAKNDTVTINKIRKEYLTFNDQIVIKNNEYVEKNTESYISLLIIQGMFANPNADLKKIRKYFDALDSEIKETTTGKKVNKQIEEFEKASKTPKK